MSLQNKGLLSLVFACLLFAACNSAPPPTAVKPTPRPQAQAPASADAGHGHDESAIASAQRITLEEAKKEFDAGTAVFVDTRDQVSFRFKRIKGAINVPAEAMDLRYKEIPQGKKIIAYCS